MKKSALLYGLMSMLGSAYATNMAYVEVNSNPLQNMGCYIRSDNNKPYIDMVAIFAANINGKSPN